MNKLTVIDISFGPADKANTIFPVIISDEAEMLLIDCGYPGALPKIRASAKEKGLDLDRLTKVVITHHDYDHMGALAELKREYPKLQVISSIEDEPYISGKVKSLRLQQAEAIFDMLPEEEKEGARSFHRMLKAVENVSVDICVCDKDYFPWGGGVEIVATPGHMPGHISVYSKATRTLIAGDAMVVENGELAVANPRYTLDMEGAKASMRKLLDYEIDRILCYHGGSFSGNIKETIQRLTK